jgi:hypothetical protein
MCKFTEKVFIRLDNVCDFSNPFVLSCVCTSDFQVRFCKLFGFTPHPKTHYPQSCLRPRRYYVVPKTQSGVALPNRTCKWGFSFTISVYAPYLQSNHFIFMVHRGYLLHNSFCRNLHFQVVGLSVCHWLAFTT